jgi:LCP family protein required for cell wall assembly
MEPATLYDRLPQGAPPARPQPRPTTSQRFLEYALFMVFGVTLLLAAVAAAVANSDWHRNVPNRLEAGITADRVNVLFIASSVRSRPSTQALMLVSVKPSTREVAMISVPSDLWVRLGRYGTRRLGAALQVGRRSGYPGGGNGLMADTVAEVLGQPVHAFVHLDSTELARVVDAIGGIDLEVRRGAYDARTGDRFTRGHHHLDGRLAARYAFSRRMAGQANDRFAREARQRAMLAALLEKTSRVDPAWLGQDPDPEVTNFTTDQVAWMRDLVAGRSARKLTLAPYFDVFNVVSLTEKGEALRPRSGNFDQIRWTATHVFPAASNAH